MSKAFNTAWIFLKGIDPANETYLKDLQDMAGMGSDVYQQGHPEGLFYEQIDPELQHYYNIPNPEKLMNLQREMKPHEGELMSQFMAPPTRGSERVRPTPKDKGPLEEMESGKMRRMPTREERFGDMEHPILNPGHYNRFLQSESAYQKLLEELHDNEFERRLHGDRRQAPDRTKENMLMNQYLDTLQGRQKMTPELRELILSDPNLQERIEENLKLSKLK